MLAWKNEKVVGVAGIVVALALASGVASAAYKAGNLYVNVHSAANKSGEIRGQLKP